MEVAPCYKLRNTAYTDYIALYCFNSFGSNNMAIWIHGWVESSAYPLDSYDYKKLSIINCLNWFKSMFWANMFLSRQLKETRGRKERSRRSGRKERKGARRGKRRRTRISPLTAPQSPSLKNLSWTMWSNRTLRWKFVPFWDLLHFEHSYILNLLCELNNFPSEN